MFGIRSAVAVSHEVHLGPALSVLSFSPNNQEILAGMNKGDITLYDIERRKKLWSGRGERLVARIRIAHACVIV